jgi:hypothetical protein
MMTLALAAAVAASPVPVELPFSLEANHIIIEVVVNGVPARAIFDTGGRTVLTPELAQRLGLTTSGHVRAEGAGAGSVGASLVQLRSLALGPIVLKEQPAVVIPLPRGITHATARPVEMIVGYEIFRKFVTTFDYPKNTVRLIPTEGYIAPPGSVGIPISFEVTAPVVAGTIDGIPAKFVIDTGSGSALTLHSPFVAAHQMQQRFHTVGEMVVGRGVGGYVRGIVARGGDLTLGPERIHSPLVLLSTDAAGAGASHSIDGNVGGALLAPYAVTFDYERHRMYLAGPVGPERPTIFSRSGVYAVRDDPRFYLVIDVLANGPAASAGMKAGDRIIAIDGKPATEIEGEAWRAIVAGPPGTAHSLTLERDAMRLEVILTLRDLI